MTIVYLNHEPLDTYLSRQTPPDNPLAETKSLGLNLGDVLFYIYVDS